MRNNINKDGLKFFYEVLSETCQDSRLLESRQYIQHGNTTVLQHSISVAYYSYRFAVRYKLNVSKKELIRGALLHDYFLYDWHIKDTSHRLHGFRHPYFALKNACKDFELSDVEKDIIKKHMYPLTPVPPIYMESMIVCLVDKVCSFSETFHMKLLRTEFGPAF